jgi:uncharacterized Fe-S radical SAM superfamily protein PflX
MDSKKINSRRLNLAVTTLAERKLMSDLCSIFHTGCNFSCIFLDLEISKDFNILIIAYSLQAFYSQNMQVLG